MLDALRRRADRDEEGFTLIELMVVVLIIAILIAIAVPTFLGARQKAQARAAQSNVRNAYSAAKTLFTDHEKFSSDGTSATARTELAAIEPSLAFAAAVSSTDPKQVQVDLADTVGTVVTGGVLCITSQGANGKFYSLRDISVGTNVGVSYRTHDTAAPSCDTNAAGWTAKW